MQHDLAGPVKTDSSFWTIGETQNFNNHVDIDFLFLLLQSYVLFSLHLISIFVLPIGAICGVETSNLWSLAESLSKSNHLLQILSCDLTLKFAPSATW